MPYQRHDIYLIDFTDTQNRKQPLQCTNYGYIHNRSIGGRIAKLPFAHLKKIALDSTSPTPLLVFAPPSTDGLKFLDILIYLLVLYNVLYLLEDKRRSSSIFIQINALVNSKMILILSLSCHQSTVYLTSSHCSRITYMDSERSLTKKNPYRVLGERTYIA